MTPPAVSKFPQRIVIELTPACNLSCPMCPRHYIDEHDGFMPFDLWRKLIDEVAEAAPESIVLPFWRGESLLHPRFADAINYALARRVRIHISTNGELVAGEMAECLARTEFVTFSIHSEKGFNNAVAFQSLARKAAAKVQISFVEGEVTAGKYLEKIVTSPDLMGFDGVRLYEEHTKDGVFGKGDTPAAGNRIFCPKLVDTLVISSTGEISRCNHIWTPEKEKNVKSATIGEAWNSPVMNRIRERYPDEKCGPCDQWTGHTCGEAWRRVDGKVEKVVFNIQGAV